MNKKQVLWAKQHDWFVCEREGVVYAESIELDKENNRVLESVSFTDFEELRAWAGY